MNDDAIPDLLADKMDFSGKSVVLDEGRSQGSYMGLEGRRPKARPMADYLAFLHYWVNKRGSARNELALFLGRILESCLFTLCDANFTADVVWPASKEVFQLHVRL